jgi:hypothetical protein
VIQHKTSFYVFVSETIKLQRKGTVHKIHFIFLSDFFFIALLTLIGDE